MLRTKTKVFAASLILTSCFIPTIRAQPLTTFKIDKWTFKTSALSLEKFFPWSTHLIVEQSKQVQIPTLYSIEPPKVERIRVTADFESAKNKWISAHPHSDVIEIHFYPILISQGMNDGREAYVWIFADGSILNVELVRAGACPAEAMLLDPENESYVLIPRALYERVKGRLLEAEDEARKARRGIWSSDLRSRN